jgi:hypothetical protein
LFKCQLITKTRLQKKANMTQNIIHQNLKHTIKSLIGID